MSLATPNAFDQISMSRDYRFTLSVRPTIRASICNIVWREKKRSLDELEKVVKELEGGDLALERSLELFEKGMRLSETCRKQLEEAETRVEMLIRREGKIQPEPFRPDKA